MNIPQRPQAVPPQQPQAQQPQAQQPPQRPQGPITVGAQAHAPAYMQRGGVNAGEHGQPWNFRFNRG
jgi:hypothetical protein